MNAEGNLTTYRTRTMEFSVARCSDQDFAARMARYDAILVECTTHDRTKLYDNYQRLGEQLHVAMGFRADHGNPDLEF
jgi:hypothetical protein